MEYVPTVALTNHPNVDRYLYMEHMGTIIYYNIL